MRTSSLGHFALIISVAAALLTGCNGAQPPIAPPGAMAQRVVPAMRSPRDGSWMLPNASSGDLLYVVGAEGSYSIVYVFSYPAGVLVGKIIHDISGICSNAQGDVFMTQTWYAKSRILKYAHGGKKPIETLGDSYTNVGACAVDPTNGNLAVANGEGGTILVYPGAKGTPKAYNIWFYPNYIAYDNTGTLYVLGQNGELADLAKNGQFQKIRLQKLVNHPTGLQYDGQYMALGAGQARLIRRYAIKRGVAQWIGDVSLKPSTVVAFYVEGSTVAASDGEDAVHIFNYPAGGNPTGTISSVPKSGSLTVSVAPSKRRVRPAFGSLLYLLPEYNGRKVSVFAFPGGKRAGDVMMPGDGTGSICSDTHGHVFVPGDDAIFEYAHGGKTPIATLRGIPQPNGCAADPTTDDLAVLTYLGPGKCTIEIYKSAKGSPVAHPDSDFSNCSFPTYDNRGDLFFDGNGNKGSVLAELPAGSSKFVNITLSQSIPNIFFLQWDGEDVAIQARELGSEDLPVVIFRTQVAGTKGTVVAKIRFQYWTRNEVQFSVQGDEIVAQSGTNELGIWKYPHGGKLLESFPATLENFALTVSAAP